MSLSTESCLRVWVIGWRLKFCVRLISFFMLKLWTVLLWLFLRPTIVKALATVNWLSFKLNRKMGSLVCILNRRFRIACFRLEILKSDSRLLWLWTHRLWSMTINSNSELFPLLNVQLLHQLQPNHSHYHPTVQTKTWIETAVILNKRYKCSHMINQAQMMVDCFCYMKSAITVLIPLKVRPFCQHSK